MKQKELSKWLKAIVVLGALCVFFLGGVIAPDIGGELSMQNPQLANMYRPCLIFIWITAVPVCAVLVLTWQIAVEIGHDNSFCYKNAARLRTVSVMALTDMVLYMAGGAYLALNDMLHISVFLLIIGFLAIGAAITVASAALSHLTRKAADLKSENDLTI